LGGVGRRTLDSCDTEHAFRGLSELMNTNVSVCSVGFYKLVLRFLDRVRYVPIRLARVLLAISTRHDVSIRISRRKRSRQMSVVIVYLFIYFLI